MSKKIISEDQKRLHEVKVLYDNQKNKKFDYKFEDFEINGNTWKYKSWKTFVKGGNNYTETSAIIHKYIAECKKPYGKRNLDFIHLA